MKMKEDTMNESMFRVLLTAEDAEGWLEHPALESYKGDEKFTRALLLAAYDSVGIEPSYAILRNASMQKTTSLKTLEAFPCSDRTNALNLIVNYHGHDGTSIFPVIDDEGCKKEVRSLSLTMDEFRKMDFFGEFNLLDIANVTYVPPRYEKKTVVTQEDVCLFVLSYEGDEGLIEEDIYETEEEAVQMANAFLDEDPNAVYSVRKQWVNDEMNFSGITISNEEVQGAMVNLDVLSVAAEDAGKSSGFAVFIPTHLVNNPRPSKPGITWDLHAEA